MERFGSAVVNAEFLRALMKKFNKQPKNIVNTKGFVAEEGKVGLARRTLQEMTSKKADKNPSSMDHIQELVSRLAIPGLKAEDLYKETGMTIEEFLSRPTGQATISAGREGVIIFTLPLDESVANTRRMMSGKAADFENNMSPPEMSLPMALHSMQHALFGISGILLSFVGNLAAKADRGDLADHMEKLMRTVNTVGQVIIDKLRNGSIIVEVTMSEIDTIHMLEAFSEGRLDHIGLFRIDFTKLTPKLDAAIAGIKGADGTEVREINEGGARKVSLAREIEAGQTPAIKPSRRPGIAERILGSSAIFRAAGRGRLATPPDERAKVEASKIDPPSNAKQPGGFYFIDLLATCSVLGVLIALLLPAVRAAREAQRRAQCINNLKQLGLALANYESTHQAYPLACGQRAIWDPMNRSGTYNDAGWGNWSPQAMLLGHLEQGQAYNAINFSVSAADFCDGGINATAKGWVISSFLCPSSPKVSGKFPDASVTPWLAGEYPGNNYWGSVGPGPVPWSSNTSMRGLLGTVSPGSNGSRSTRDVTDGTSNTIAFGEWKVGDFDRNKLSLSDAINIRTNTVATFGNWNGNTNMPDVGSAVFQQFLNACVGAAPASVGTNNNKSTMGRSWANGMMGQTLGTTLLAPNPQYPNCNMQSWGGDMDGPGMYNLSSYHPGGANAAMADGSVRFLRNETNLNAIWSLGSRNGGEVLSPESY